MNLLPLITLQTAHANSQIPKQNTAWSATQAANSMKESATGPCLPTVQKSTTIQGSVFFANRNIFITRLQRNVSTLNLISVISMMEEENASSASKTTFSLQDFASANVLYPNLIIVIQMIREATVWSASKDTIYYMEDAMFLDLLIAR
jgi:hypothetical protein